MEPFAAFERRARAYPLPVLMSPEEQVKADLKSWRQPERLRLTARLEATYGRVLPIDTARRLDVARLRDALPDPHRTVLILYFCTRRPTYPRAHDDCACRSTCQAHYGNPQIAQALAATPHQVAAWKRAGVARIAASLYPAYYRAHKALAGV